MACGVGEPALAEEATGPAKINRSLTSESRCALRHLPKYLQGAEFQTCSSMLVRDVTSANPDTFLNGESIDFGLHVAILTDATF
jgi:hypothetical protein